MSELREMRLTFQQNMVDSTAQILQAIQSRTETQREKVLLAELAQVSLLQGDNRAILIIH